MSEIIELADGLRIRRLDRMNVTVEKYVHDEKKDTWSWYQANGNGRGPFCGSEAVACRWVLDHGLMDEAGQTDLEGALAEYARVAGRLERAVKAVAR